MYVDRSFCGDDYCAVDFSIPSRWAGPAAVRGCCDQAGGSVIAEYRLGIECRWFAGPHLLGIVDRLGDHGIPSKEVSNLGPGLARLRPLRRDRQDPRWLQSTKRTGNAAKYASGQVRDESTLGKEGIFGLQAELVEACSEPERGSRA